MKKKEGRKEIDAGRVVEYTPQSTDSRRPEWKTRHNNNNNSNRRPATDHTHRADADGLAARSGSPEVSPATTQGCRQREEEVDSVTSCTPKRAARPDSPRREEKAGRRGDAHAQGRWPRRAPPATAGPRPPRPPGWSPTRFLAVGHHLAHELEPRPTAAQSAAEGTMNSTSFMGRKKAEPCRGHHAREHGELGAQSCLCAHDAIASSSSSTSAAISPIGRSSPRERPSSRELLVAPMSACVQRQRATVYAASPTSAAVASSPNALSKLAPMLP